MSAPATPTSDFDDSALAPQIYDGRDSTTTVENDATTEDNTHRCFICLVDEPDGEIPEDWVTPCQCSLEGHQSCLLTWVADLEAQEKLVQCPLCKSKIEVVDRWDPAVQLSDALVRQFSGLSPMVLLSFGVGGIFMSSALYGMQSLEVFAGPESAMRYIFVEPENEGYLNTLIERFRSALPALNPNDTVAARDMLARNGIPVSAGARVDWIHFFSLTLIAPALILNRMSLGGAVMLPSSLMVSYARYVDSSRDY